MNNAIKLDKAYLEELIVSLHGANQDIQYNAICSIVSLVDQIQGAVAGLLELEPLFLAILSGLVQFDLIHRRFRFHILQGRQRGVVRHPHLVVALFRILEEVI